VNEAPYIQPQVPKPTDLDFLCWPRDKGFSRKGMLRAHQWLKCRAKLHPTGSPPQSPMWLPAVSHTLPPQVRAPAPWALPSAGVVHVHRPLYTLSLVPFGP
jgi:hypothetical protein